LSKPKLPTYRGRSIGIAALTGAQLLIGSIHVFFGILLLAYENATSLQSTVTYDVYTIVFGSLTILFAVFIWRGKKAGWIGTISVSVFVIIADSLTLLDLPSIPGIPKFAGATEIVYSVVIIAYLLSTWKRANQIQLKLP
jgi:hypothetical protein